MPPSSHSTRATPPLLLAIAAALLLARIAFGIIDATHPENRPELVQWTAPSAAAEAARASGRPALYAFTDRKDGTSNKMSSEFFSAPQVARQFEQRFVAVRIEGPPSSDTPETAALRERFAVRQVPTLVVVSPDGSKSKQVVGYQNAMATMQDLGQAQLEVMGMPFNGGGRGFRFQVGSHGIHGGDSMIVIPDDADSLARGR